MRLCWQEAREGCLAPGRCRSLVLYCTCLMPHSLLRISVQYPPLSYQSSCLVYFDGCQQLYMTKKRWQWSKDVKRGVALLDPGCACLPACLKCPLPAACCLLPACLPATPLPAHQRLQWQVSQAVGWDQPSVQSIRLWDTEQHRAVARTSDVDALMSHAPTSHSHKLQVRSTV